MIQFKILSVPTVKAARKASACKGCNEAYVRGREGCYSSKCALLTKTAPVKKTFPQDAYPWEAHMLSVDPVKIAASNIIAAQTPGVTDEEIRAHGGDILGVMRAQRAKQH